MGITGKKRSRRPCRGGSTSGRSKRKRDPPLVAADSYSPVGGVQSIADNSMGSIFVSDSTGSNSRRRSARVRGRGVPSRGVNLKFIKKFKHYLNGHCEGIADAMWNSNTFEMQINFSTIRVNHKQLSDEIVDHMHKKMEEEVHSTLIYYLREQFIKKDFIKRFGDLEHMMQHIRDNARLTLIDVPDRIESLQDVLDLPLSGPYNKNRILFANHPKKHSVPITSDSQLLILIGSFDYLISCHKEGKSWGGVWTRNNWDIVDGKPCLFAPAEPGEANQASCKLDLAKYATEFLSPFADKDGKYPANIKSLFVELSKPLQLSDDQFFGWYYEFLSFHPCFFMGSARIMLVTGWYHLVEYLGYGVEVQYSAVFARKFNWTWRFQKRSRVHEILWLVFWNRKKPSPKFPYDDTLGHNFMLMRQLQEHAYRNTKLTGNLQTVERSDETDLYAEDQFPFTLAELIKCLFKENLMVGEFLDRYEEFKKLRGPRSRRGG